MKVGLNHNSIFKSQVRISLYNKEHNARYTNDLNKSLKMNFDEAKMRYSAITSGKNTNRSTNLSQSCSNSSYKSINIVNNNWNKTNQPLHQFDLNISNLKASNNISHRGSRMKDLAESMTSLNEKYKISSTCDEDITAKSERKDAPIARRLIILKNIQKEIQENMPFNFRSASVKMKDRQREKEKEKDIDVKETVKEVFFSKIKKKKKNNSSNNNFPNAPILLKMSRKPKLNVPLYENL